MKLTPIQLKALIAGGKHEYGDVHATLRTLWSLHRLGLVQVPTTAYQGAARGWAHLTNKGREVIAEHERKQAAKQRASDAA